jgi:uncharacterized membrane protein YdjX (TVP38/TMEM64 family)
MKRNVVAAALSAVLPGAGQLYTHHWAKGVGFLIAAMGISAVIRRRMLLTAPSMIAMLVVGVLFGLAVWSVVDAYRSDK